MDEQQMIQQMAAMQGQGEETPMPEDMEAIPGEEGSEMDSLVPDGDTEGVMDNEMMDEGEFPSFYEDEEAPMNDFDETDMAWDEAEPEDDGIDVLEAVKEMVLQYIDHATAVKDDGELNAQVKSQVMSQMAQAVNYLVPLLPNTQEQDMKAAELEMQFQQKQAEMELKAQEHEMNMQFKREELQMKLEEQRTKAQLQQQQNQQKMIQEKEKHNQSLVQNEQSHQHQLKQQKQAAQSKPTSKDSK